MNYYFALQLATEYIVCKCFCVCTQTSADLSYDVDKKNLAIRVVLMLLCKLQAMLIGLISCRVSMGPLGTYT